MKNKPSEGRHLSIASSSTVVTPTESLLSPLPLHEINALVSQVESLLPLWVYALNGHSYILDAKIIMEKLAPVRYGLYDITRDQIASVIPFLEKKDYLTPSGYRSIFYPISQSDFIEENGKIPFKNIDQLLSVELPIGEDHFLMNIFISYEWNIQDEHSLVSIKPETFKNGKHLISLDFFPQDTQFGQLVDNAVPKLLSFAHTALNQFALSHIDGLGAVAYIERTRQTSED